MLIPAEGWEGKQRGWSGAAARPFRRWQEAGKARGERAGAAGARAVGHRPGALLELARGGGSRGGSPPARWDAPVHSPFSLPAPFPTPVQDFGLFGPK